MKKQLRKNYYSMIQGITYILVLSVNCQLLQFYSSVFVTFVNCK